MVKKIQIQNFKSVHDIDLDLGRLNVFIGENGCGKTNLLEGIAMGSAAFEDKLDNEFLFPRGVRVTKPDLMQSAFDITSEKFPFKRFYVNLFVSEDKYLLCTFRFNDGKWSASLKHDISLPFSFERSIIRDINTFEDNPDLSVLREKALSLKERFDDVQVNSQISSFLIYSPENSKLRRFEDEGQILPLGVGGEGLFRHLVEISREQPDLFKQIKKNLEIIDWFDDLDVPSDLMFTERRLNIRDRFIHPDIQFFDQRSANEGFLFLLFYFTLFTSKSTPNFFAIDNIDTALNPKLCIKLIQTLSRLSKEHSKQAIVTTHNPAILDGLDLDDDDQRLFVVYRNALGHTIAKRVQKKASLSGSESIRLSEAFIRGYLGGLPKNF